MPVETFLIALRPFLPNRNRAPISEKLPLWQDVNDHYLKLAAGYLFPEIGRRVDASSASANPDRQT